jgi:hypothetical protein
VGFGLRHETASGERVRHRNTRGAQRAGGPNVAGSKEVKALARSVEAASAVEACSEWDKSAGSVVLGARAQVSQ